MVTNPFYYQRCMGGARAARPLLYESPHRHLRLELSVRRGHVERPLLPRLALEARRDGRLRRTLVLRRALRHGRGELDLLWAAARGGDPRVGDAHASLLRVFAEAVSEVHAPEDVSRG